MAAFGSGTWQVSIGPPDQAPICGPLPVLFAQGEYVTDDHSYASAELDGVCCTLCPEMRPLFHELTLWRDTKPVWWGPIRPEGIYTVDGRLHIEAISRSFWDYNQRVGVSGTVEASPAEHLHSLFTMGERFPGRTATVITADTAATVELELEPGDSTGDHIASLEESSDWATVGGTTWIGAPNIDPGLPALDLNDGTLDGDAGRSFVGDGWTSASKQERQDQLTVETHATSPMQVPWTLHTVTTGVPSDIVADPVPRRSLVVSSAALSARVGVDCVTELIPGRRAMVTSECDPNRPDEQIVSRVGFEYDAEEDIETITVGTVTPS